MSYDVVCDEAELCKAAHELERYADFLCGAIDSYERILTDVKTNGINDQAICDGITQSIDNIVPLKENIQSEIESLSAAITKFVNEIEMMDKYTFPDKSNITTLISLINAWKGFA